MTFLSGIVAIIWSVATVQKICW